VAGNQPARHDGGVSGPAIVWFRDDLRVADNPALLSAAESGRPIVPLFILDEESEGFRTLGGAQRWMLHQALAALDARISSLGARLVLRRGPAAVILNEVLSESGAAAVYWNRRHSQPAIRVDRDLKAGLIANGIEAKSYLANLLHEPSVVKTGDGGPYRVYSPFWRAFERLGPPRPPLPAPSSMNGFDGTIASLSLDELSLLPSAPDWAGGLRGAWHGSEDAAHAMLNDFVANGLKGYADGRDLPAQPHVSRLSPYLRFGILSPYQAWEAAGAGNAPPRDVEKFRKELGWREFSWHLLHHYPDLGWRNFDARFDDFPWRSQGDEVREWQRGMTGYPMVDAGMRELWTTGYMHNRVRMIVASFLVKHLMVDWRVGESWFWDTLVDGDLANNAASWQWVAGCGADAAPYFRIFNPIVQGEKFDPAGRYVRKWLPELARVPDRFIHKPWDAPREILAAAGVELGKNYPAPLVEHVVAREKALQAFESLKKAS
jgi:deoxyribodipyrimidine photo-lyase